MEQNLTVYSQTPKQLTQFTSNLKKKVIDQAEASEATVMAAVTGYHDQLRRMEDPARVLAQQLPFIAQEYGARTAILPHVQSECIRLILEKFGHIGFNEIREAYRLYASGEIRIKGGEMYGGEFNAGQLGKVLSAYNEHRKQIIAAYTEALHVTAEEIEEAKRAEESRMRFEAKFREWLKKAKAEQTDWRDIPAYYYDAAMNRGLIEFKPGEKRQIWEDALILAETEFQEDVESEFGRKVNAVLQQDQLEGRARVIAQKLSVFRKLIIKEPEEMPF